MKTKNYKEAIKVIEGIKNKNAILNKAYQQVCYYRGVQEYNDKNTEASIVLLDKSLGYPIDKEIQGEALFLKGEIFYNKAQYTKANVEYDKYIQVAKLENLNRHMCFNMSGHTSIDIFISTILQSNTLVIISCVDIEI